MLACVTRSTEEPNTHCTKLGRDRCSQALDPRNSSVLDGPFGGNYQCNMSRDAFTDDRRLVRLLALRPW